MSPLLPVVPGASTNLKRDASKTEDSLCDWIQLEAVKDCWSPREGTHLRKDSPVFDHLVHDPLRSCVHHRGVFL